MACDSLKPALPALCCMANIHGLRNAGQLEQSTAKRNAKHCAYVRQCPLLVSQSQSITALITQAKMNSCQHVKTTTSATLIRVKTVKTVKKQDEANVMFSKAGAAQTVLL